MFYHTWYSWTKNALLTKNWRGLRWSYLLSDVYIERKESAHLIIFMQFQFCRTDIKLNNTHCTKNEVSIKDFFSKCGQISRKLRIWSCLLKISLMEKFIFCAVTWLYQTFEKFICKKGQNNCCILRQGAQTFKGSPNWLKKIHRFETFRRYLVEENIELKFNLPRAPL